MLTIVKVSKTITIIPLLYEYKYAKHNPQCKSVQLQSVFNRTYRNLIVSLSSLSVLFSSLNIMYNDASNSFEKYFFWVANFILVIYILAIALIKTTRQLHFKSIHIYYIYENIT